MYFVISPLISTNYTHLWWFVDLSQAWEVGSNTSRQSTYCFEHCCGSYCIIFDICNVDYFEVMRCLLPHLRKCYINAMQWFFASTQYNILYLFTFCQGKLSINTYTLYQQICHESIIHFSSVIVKLTRLAILVTVMLFGQLPWISSVFCSLLCIVCICGSWGNEF